jgi:hypothetical protein
VALVGGAARAAEEPIVRRPQPARLPEQKPQRKAVAKPSLAKRPADVFPLDVAEEAKDQDFSAFSEAA